MAFPSCPPRATSRNRRIQKQAFCPSNEPEPEKGLSRAKRSLSLAPKPDIHSQAVFQALGPKGSNRRRTAPSSWLSRCIHRPGLTNLFYLDIPAATIAALILISSSPPSTLPQAINPINPEAKH